MSDPQSQFSFNVYTYGSH